jgi:hypothetical protein
MNTRLIAHPNSYAYLKQPLGLYPRPTGTSAQ